MFCCPAIIYTLIFSILLLRMRQVILFINLILVTVSASDILAQEIYVSEPDWIYIYDVTTCKKEAVCYLPDTYFNDIAFHPDGSLYGTGSTKNSSLGFLSYLYKIDLKSCTSKLIDSLPIFSNGLVCDKDGILYFGLSELLSYDTKTGQSKIYGSLPFECACDFIFYKGSLYTTINDGNTEVSSFLKVNIDQLRSSVSVFNDINFPRYDNLPISCDSYRTIGIGGNMLDKTGKVISGIIDIDIKNGIGNLLCGLSPFENGSSLGASSPLEFLASDPECDLLFDLDRDNSSGVFPYDYRNETIACATAKTASIVDTDVYLHTTAPLDSIVISISGAQDGAAEVLTLSAGLPDAFLLSHSGKYILTLTGSDRSDGAWLKALKAIRYTNSRPTATPGLRTITLTAHNAIKSNQAKAYIQMEQPPYAGKDTTITMCHKKTITGVLQILGGQSGGVWLPPFASQDTYHPDLDQPRTYRYITQNVCGRDTALFTVITAPSRTLDLGPKSFVLFKIRFCNTILSLLVMTLLLSTSAATLCQELNALNP